MNAIYSFIDTHNIPLLTSFLVGILTSISPCPLATNITAIAYISKEIKTPKHTLLNGLFYTIGRGISYTLLAILIYFGFSAFEISKLFQGWGDKVLGFILIGIGLIMLGVININIGNKNDKVEKLKEFFASKGYVGSMLLGMLFALVFCPYSGVLFFGVLMPLVLKSSEALLLPPVYALGTGLPVIIFSFIIAFGMKHLGKVFQTVAKVEKVSRIVVGSIFLIAGVYYLQFTLKYLIENLK